MRSRAWPELLRLTLLAAVGVAAYLTLRGYERPGRPVPAVALPPAAGVVGDLHSTVSLGSLMIVVLRTPSVAQRLSPGAPPSGAQMRSWSAEDEAAQQQVLSELASHALAVRPLYSFTRVLDGFSASLPARALGLLAQDPEVAGVYPVRVAYPATLAPAMLRGVAGAQGAGIALPGLDGSGVSIALLDTGVNASSPSLAGRVSGVIDVVGDAGSAAAAGGETHGTELAGLLVGAAAAGAPGGVAPGASLLSIRVAALQPDGHGGDALYARSDQLIAGLDHAVDPSGRGELPSSVRVALLGVAEPFDGFADTPEAQAVAGATALGLLVVAPAGDDGPAGPWYGSIAGPGGSPAALTVGAVDARREMPAERVVVRAGLEVVGDSRLPLLDAAAPQRPLETRLLDARSRLATHGVALLLAGGANPLAAVARASAAGARAVLLEGAPPAAGSLDGVPIPVLWVPPALTSALTRALARGEQLAVSLGAVAEQPNPDYAALAPFSSHGLAFDGLVDPELSAPGVDVAAATPGRRGQPAYAALSGTAVAAASVAGAAALLVEARPGLSPRELASLLAGAARPSRFALSAGGSGVLDLGASAAAEIAASATAVGFGVERGTHWHETRALAVENVSTRRIVVTVESRSPLVTVTPPHLTLAPGASVTLRIEAHAGPTAAGGAAGVLVLAPAGSEPLRVPWTIGAPPRGQRLLGAAALSRTSFAPSLRHPALLHVAVGALAGARTLLELEPVSRLDVDLYAPGGRYLGLLASLRDLLPGRYAFALTGRSPDGARLAPGAYELELVAWPVLGGRPSRLGVPFRIE